MPFLSGFFHSSKTDRRRTPRSNTRRKSAASAGQWLLVTSVLFLAMGGTAATDAAGRFDSLGHKMMCTCGCAQVLLECNHVGCPVSGGMRDELASAITRGQTDAAILDGFVERYGAVVLTAPTWHGFDLLGWLMPPLFAVLGLAGTIYLVRHWAKQQAATAPVSEAGVAVTGQTVDEAMQERIRRETGGGV